MQKQMTQRKNRTGILFAPELGQLAAEGAQQVPPSSPGSEENLIPLRKAAIAQAEPVGSVPEPVMRDAASFIPILTDKLGDRLAFERSGTRLYDNLINKTRAAGKQKAGPPINDLQHIRDEEAAHFEMLTQAVRRLGGDPTAMTPAANLSGVASSGLFQVVTDPRTTVDQCLHAILVAELADNDGWQMLIDLAKGAGHEDMARQFSSALKSEDEHLQMVRGWLKEFAQAELTTANGKKKK
jgi:ferritin-like protein